VAWYKISPLDPLFFRNMQSFAAGEETWADTVALPAPSNFYGALGTAIYAADSGVTAAAIKKGLKIKGVFLEAGGEFYFPAPLDLCQEKGRNDPVRDLYLLRFVQKKRGVSNLPKCLEGYLVPDYELLRDAEAQEFAGFLSFLEWNRYIGSEGRCFQGHALGSFVREEPKIGIKRDRKSLAAEEHMLYRAAFRRYLFDRRADRFDRWDQVRFWVEAEMDPSLPSLPASGLLRLGGEGKAAKYERCESDARGKAEGKKKKPGGSLGHEKEYEGLLRDLAELKANRVFAERTGAGPVKKFKLVFLTPAIFSERDRESWLPAGVNPENGEWEYKSMKFKLLACSTGRLLPAGGWDIKDKMPKPMRWAVPAGAVYYFEVLSKASANDILEAFHWQNLSEERAEEGFGLAAVGAA